MVRTFRIAALLLLAVPCPLPSSAAEAAPALSSASEAPARPATRYRYEVVSDDGRWLLDLVLLPSGDAEVGLLSEGDQDVVRFVARPGRLAFDLATALRLGPDLGDPRAEAVRIDHPGWATRAEGITWTAAVMERVRAGFTERWVGRAFEAGSRWAFGELSVTAGEPCEAAGLHGRLYVMRTARDAMSACFADGMALPLSVERRRRDGALERSRLEVVRRFVPGPAPDVLGNWMDVTWSRSDGGFTVRADGSAVTFAWGRPVEGRPSDAPPPASWCEMEHGERPWLWDGARLIVGTTPHRLVGDGPGARLASRLSMASEAGPDHRAHRRIDGRSRGSCADDLPPSLHERLLRPGALPAGLDLEERDEHGDTPLSWAAEHGHADLVRRLMARGARRDVRNKVPRGPVEAAAARGHLDVVRALLPQRPSSPEGREEVTSALAWAVRAGRLDVAQLLLDRGAEPNGCGPRPGAPRERRCETPALLWAAGAGRLEAVSWLLEHGAALDAVHESRGDLLLSAARSGNDALVAFLLARGMPVRRAPWEQWRYEPQIGWAMTAGNPVAAGRLARAAGLSVAVAIRFCDPDLMRILLAFDPAPARTVPTAGGGATLLQDAARCADPRVGAEVLAAGADVNAASPDDPEPPLAIAVVRGARDLVELLLAHGARPDGGGGRGGTILAAARAADRRDLHDLLVRGGGPSTKQREEVLPSGPISTSLLDDGDPAYAEPGFRRPKEREPGCVERGIGAIEGLRGTSRLGLILAVGRDGRPSQVAARSWLPNATVEAAVRRAVFACAFEPGADASGRHVALWTTLWIARPPAVSPRSGPADIRSKGH